MSRANPRFRRQNPLLPAPIGNVVMLTLFGSLENQLTINTLYYQSGTEAPTVGNLASFLSTWKTNNQANLLACSSSDWSFTQMKAQYLNAVSIIPQYNTASLPASGTGAAGHEPTTVAAILTKYSMTKGQSGRGRYYVPGIPTANVTASSITAAYAVTLAAYGTSINSSVIVGAITYIPCIFSRRNYNKVTGAGGGVSVLNTVTVRTVLGTIRRRRLGRGK